MKKEEKIGKEQNRRKNTSDLTIFPSVPLFPSVPSSLNLIDQLQSKLYNAWLIRLRADLSKRC